MKVTTVFSRGLFALLSICLMVGLTFGQTGNLVITTTSVFSGNGIYNVKKDIVNTGVATATTINGTVNLGGGAQSIGGASAGSGNINFGTLKATATGTKTFAVNSDIGTTIDIIAPAANTTKFDIGSKALKIKAGIANTLPATVPYAFGSGSVEYSADATQTIWGTSYGTLITSGALLARAKTPNGPVTVATTFTNGAKTTMDFAGNTFIYSGVVGQFSNASDGVLISAGTVTITTQTTIGGTFVYNQPGAVGQVVADAQYTNLTLAGGAGTATKSIKANVVTAVSGTYDFSASGARTYGAASTFKYNATGGSTSQSVAPDSYVNLELDGTDQTDVKTAGGSISTTGTFTNVLAKFTVGNAAYTLTVGTTGSNTGRIQFAGAGIAVGTAAGVIEYNGTVAQAVGNGTYFNLEFANGTVTTAEKTITGGTVLVNGYLTLASTAFLTVAPSGILNVPNADLTVTGSLTNNGTITVGS